MCESTSIRRASRGPLRSLDLLISPGTLLSVHYVQEWSYSIPVKSEEAVGGAVGSCSSWSGERQCCPIVRDRGWVQFDARTQKECKYQLRSRLWSAPWHCCCEESEALFEANFAFLWRILSKTKAKEPTLRPQDMAKFQMMALVLNSVGKNGQFPGALKCAAGQSGGPARVPLERVLHTCMHVSVCVWVGVCVTWFKQHFIHSLYSLAQQIGTGNTKAVCLFECYLYTKLQSHRHLRWQDGKLLSKPQRQQNKRPKWQQQKQTNQHNKTKTTTKRAEGAGVEKLSKRMI